MKRFIRNISAIVVSIFIASCNSSTNDTPSETSVDSVSTTVAEDTEQSQVVYNIPSPMETFIILKMTSVPFDKSLLNPSANVSKYVTNFSKSINLGIYSADLAFSLLYEQNKEIETYLKNTADLKSSLNIDGDFFQSLIKRIKANSSNLDSMMQIVSEANVNTNMYLNENKMNNTVALITAGGWIEGLYMLSNIAQKNPKKELVGMVADQKLVVKNLIKTLEPFASDKEIAGLLADVKDIEKLYESLKPVEGKSTTSANKNIASIGNNTSFELTSEQLKLIVDKATALRNKLTN